LPTQSELGLFSWAFVSPSLDETDWTDDATSATTHFAIHMVSVFVSFDDHPNSDSIGSRCVTTAHNNLGPTPLSAKAAKPSIRKARSAAKPSIRKARYPRIRTRHN
jgi:hypothetical protein